jgi:hypothetical protein
MIKTDRFQKMSMILACLWLFLAVVASAQDWRPVSQGEHFPDGAVHLGGGSAIPELSGLRLCSVVHLGQRLLGWAMSPTNAKYDKSFNKGCELTSQISLEAESFYVGVGNGMWNDKPSKSDFPLESSPDHFVCREALPTASSARPKLGVVKRWVSSDPRAPDCEMGGGIILKAGFYQVFSLVLTDAQRVGHATFGEPPGPNDDPKNVNLASWIFGSVLILFVMGIVAFRLTVRGPREIDATAQKIIGFLCALLSGLFVYFFTGSVEVSGSSGGGPLVQASGGAAVFVIVLWWWRTDHAPIAAKGDRGGSDR